jgi:hypothetical protein
MYARTNRSRSSKARKSHEPGRAFIRVGNHLVLVCLFFGAAFAVFVSGSIEQQIGNLLIFGLIPAVGFYAAGRMLGQLLIFGVELCDVLIASCSRKVLRLAQVELGRHPVARTHDRAEQASLGGKHQLSHRSNITDHPGALDHG